MNVEKCLGDAADAGRISRAGAEKALREVLRIIEENPAISEAQAMAQAGEKLTREAKAAKRQVAMQAIASFRNDQDLAAHPDGVKPGVRGIFARDISGKGNQFNVEGRAASIRGMMHGMMRDALDAYRSKTLGLTRDTAGLIRFVREIYGEATGDGVAGAAKAGWVKATDWGVAAFNAAGGNLQRSDSWRLPQEWDSATVLAKGPTAFLDYMDRATADGRLKVVDWETGQPVDAQRRAEIISNAYERISTDGLSDLVPGRQVNTKLANARTEKRAFEWTTADAWLDFNRTYGKGDNGIWDVITGHIDGMAQDIAMLQRLGPNPAAEARRLIDAARKEGGSVWRIEATWDQVSGAASSPVNQFWASTFGGVRAWLASAQLGSSILSSTTDFSTLKATAGWNGISTGSVMDSYLKMLNPANDADRLRAVRSGLIADGWAQRAQAANRTMMEEIGQTLPSKVLNFTMRAQGAEAHLQAGKWAFGMEFLGMLADNAGRAQDALPPELRRTMARYGVTAEDWDIIRSRGVVDEDGVKFIYPEQIAKTATDTAALNATLRMMDMINTERGFAMVEPGAAERALLLGRTRPGTLEGEFMRTFAQYKSFPVSMMTRHLARGLQSMKAGDYGRYMVATGVSLTVMAALALQMKAIATGKDPRDMADWKFWGAAFIQGGGAGIFGDFLNAGLDRSGKSFYMTAVGGPTAGLVDDLIKLTGGNISASADGKDTNFGREMANFVRRNTPGTNLWYSRLALDRLMWDRVQELADPEYQRAFRRTEDRARRDFNQEFFWGPGDRAPTRAPDPAAAFQLGR